MKPTERAALDQLDGRRRERIAGDGSWTDVNQPSEVDTCHSTRMREGQAARR